MHEHLLLDLRYSPRGYNGYLNDVELAAEELDAFKAAGGRTIVEATSMGLGRNVPGLRRIADATGLNIIVGTGYYTEQYYPPPVFENTIDQLAQVMLDELTLGIQGTETRAGIIGELGTGRGHMTPAEERVFRAAARASRATGVAITTHTSWGGELARQQVAVLVDEGASPSRIIIGHLGDTRDIELLTDLAQLGVYVEIDHIGWAEFERDSVRAQLIRELISQGYANQILLSAEVAFRSHLKAFGGNGYDFLLTRFVNELEAVGLDESTVEALLVDNPRDALTPNLTVAAGAEAGTPRAVH